MRVVWIMGDAETLAVTLGPAADVLDLGEEDALDPLAGRMIQAARSHHDTARQRKTPHGHSDERSFRTDPRCPPSRGKPLARCGSIEGGMWEGV